MVGPILSRRSTATLHAILATLLRRGTCAMAIEPEDSADGKPLHADLDNLHSGSELGHNCGTLHLLCNRSEKILQGGSRGFVVCGPQMLSEWRLFFQSVQMAYEDHEFRRAKLRGGCHT
jgi:hypothetical protein